MTYIEKFGPPKDMNEIFATLIHAGPKLEVDELMEVRGQLSKLMGKEFTEASDNDYSTIN